MIATKLADYKNAHYAWTIPFSRVEYHPGLFAGLCDVIVDTVRVAHSYLLCVRHSVINMRDFRETYEYDSSDETESDSESVVGSTGSVVSHASRVSTRSSTRKATKKNL